MNKKERKQGRETRNTLKDLEVRLIVKDEEKWWDRTMSAHHYLGFRQLVGESLKYIALYNNEPVGLMGWGAAAFKNTHRDQWIGWRPEVQWQRLRFIANNMRFLVLVQIKNFASMILSRTVKRLSGDWEAVYGHPIVLAETFIDRSRFRGTCYRAAGWIPLGQTKGFRRNGGRYYYHGQPKEILVRALCKDARQLLCSEFLPPQLDNKEGIVDLNSVNLEGDKGLFARLEQITDPRKPRGIRHSHNSVIAIAICACLSGCRGYAAIGEWASNLTQQLRIRFRCRQDERTGEYVAPSEPTIRRVLQKTDPDEVDHMIGKWLEDSPVEAIAVDGKTLRGSKTKEKKGVHLLAALVHKEGLVIGQKEVDSKTNEIKAFKPLLDDIDLQGKIVTADAMHAQTDHARYVKKRGGEYVFIVINNQSCLLEAIKDLDSDFFSP